MVGFVRPFNSEADGPMFLDPRPGFRRPRHPDVVATGLKSINSVFDRKVPLF
jgi:hypothetical protein